jgi:virginiamycin B lyase
MNFFMDLVSRLGRVRLSGAGNFAAIAPATVDRNSAILREATFVDGVDGYKVKGPDHPEKPSMLRRVFAIASLAFGIFIATAAAQQVPQVQHYTVAAGSGPHDVAAAPDGTVWYTAQRAGALGILDPKTGRDEHVPLGQGSAPHGVIVGPDGAAWITDGGLNAIVRVDPRTKAIRSWPLPADAPNANLNTAAFDKQGRIWFTGQSGFHGRLNPATSDMKVWRSPRGGGPYGITGTPAGDIYFVSLARNYLAKVNLDTGEATIIEPPTANNGARRVWSDSKGDLWISEWGSGNLSRYRPSDGSWKAWRPAGERAQTYSVYVDEADKVWITQWALNAIMRFDPLTETFQSFPSDKPGANVRQMLGRPGEAWGAESGLDRLVVIRYPK